MTPKSKDNKSKNKQVGLYQTKKLLTAKETINKVKRQPTEWEKKFANDITDKALTFKTYKELIQLKSKTKIKQSN